MIKRIHIISISALVFFILVGIGTLIFYSKTENKGEKLITTQKSISEYKKIWEDSFLYYQNTLNQIEDYGIFNFEFSAKKNGSVSPLMQDMGYDTDIASISINLFGDYDFSKIENPSLNATARIYTDRKLSETGDIDISFWINESKQIVYKINKLDSEILKKLGINNNYIEGLKQLQDNNENLFGNFQDFASILTNNSQDPILYQNNKDEEQKIIQAFLDTETIRITGGESVGKLDKVNFIFDSKNFLQFMNKVSEIINPTNPKDFSNTSKQLENIILEGEFDIQEKLIVNSYIKTEFLLSSINKESLDNQNDIILIESNLQIKDPTYMNFSLTSNIRHAKTPHNYLTITIKGKIK